MKTTSNMKKNNLHIITRIGALAFFLFGLALQLNAQANLIVYPQEPKAVLSKNYQVFVNDTPVSVYSVGTNNDVSYAHFAFAGKVTVRIQLKTAVDTYNISPHSYNIVSSKSGQDITFDLDTPRKLIIQNINKLGENLCILADPLEENPPKIGDANVVNIMSSGIDDTGARDGLNEIQNALNTMPDGGILYFPPGRYTAGGGINMVSNKSIYLAGGAAIQAGPSGRLTLFFDNASNVKIFGRGSIDGMGDTKRAAVGGEGDKTCTLMNKYDASTSDNCTIEDITMKGSITWNAIIIGTTNWTIYNTKVINGKAFGNHDGWDPHNAVNMMLDNNFIYGSDDCIALSITRDNLSLNSMFRNNVFTNTNSGATVRIGPWIGQNTKNVTFENNDHIVCGNNEYSLAFYLGGSISGFKYLNSRVENAPKGLILMRTSWNDFYAGTKSGSADNILFDRLTVEDVQPGYEGAFSALEGPSATNFVNNITFKDYYQKGVLQTSNTTADMKFTGSNVSNVKFTTSTTPVVNITASGLFANRTGATPAKFIVSRTGGSTANSLTVKYKIHGTAVNTTDYSGIPDSVTIPAGMSQIEIVITPNQVLSTNEYSTVFLSLSSSENNSYILGPGFHSVITILNGSSDPSPDTNSGEFKIINPGFEEGFFNAWSDWGGNTVLDTQTKNSGNNAFQLKDKGGRGQSFTSGFKAGEKYTISAYVVASNPNGKIYVGAACLFDGKETMYFGNAITNTGSFEKTSFSFTIPVGTKELDIYGWSEGGDTYGVIDDFNLVKGGSGKSVVGSNVITGNLSSESLSIVPNPNKGSFNITFDGLQKDNYFLEVTNLLGQSVYKENLNTISGDLSKQLIIQSKEKGVYVITLTNSNNNKISKKLVVN